MRHQLLPSTPDRATILPWSRLRLFLYRHPFLTLAVVTGLVVGTWAATGLEYDEGILGFLLFIVSYFLLIPFMFSAALVGTFIESDWAAAISIPLALSLYFLGDWLVAQWRLRTRGA